LIVQLKNERLVLITGCCHAGIINTIRFARKLTGIEKVYFNLKHGGRQDIFRK